MRGLVDDGPTWNVACADCGLVAYATPWESPIAFDLRLEREGWQLDAPGMGSDDGTTCPRCAQRLRNGR